MLQPALDRALPRGLRLIVYWLTRIGVFFLNL
jgi:hypothetical protein